MTKIDIHNYDDRLQHEFTLTSTASHSSITSVVAVVHSNSTMSAVNESRLCPSAVHIVQENTSSAPSEARVAVG